MVSNHEIQAACKKYGSQRAAAKALGIPRTTMRRRLNEGCKAKKVDKVVVDERGDDATVTLSFDHPPTSEEILLASGLDPKVWRVESHERGQWTTTMNLDGVPTQVLNWSVKAYCKRINPKIVEDTVNDLYSKLRLDLPKPKRSKKKKSHLLEISICDLHLGKRCWAQESGSDYDLSIATSDYRGAIDDLLYRASLFDVDKIVLPVGSDFYNIDDSRGQTYAGTSVESTDDRLSKVWSTGLQCVRYAIEQARQIADVDVLFIPGNHDPTTASMMCLCLEALYENDKHVSVDASPMSRKYRKFGCAMMGYAHGNGLPLKNLPLIMACESPVFWAETKYRRWRLGHFHKRAQTSYVSTDSINGVQVDILPSLSGVDSWHYSHGFVGQPRSSELWIWERDAGYVGHFSEIARSDKERLEAN